MNLFKKLQAVMLCITIAVSIFIITGCEEKDPNYPITIGNVIFEEQPEKVAVLSPNAADIVKFMGYNDRVACISDNVAKSGYENVPTCGPSITPDINAIINSGANAVIADDNLSDVMLLMLDRYNIKAIQLHYYNEPSDVMTTYTTIGAVFNGKTGKLNAQSSFNNMLEQLSIYKRAIGTKYEKKTLLYLNGKNEFTTVINGSWYNNLLDYTGVTVLSDKIKKPSLSVTQIAKYKPYYIVADKNTVKNLGRRSMLKGLSALKNKRYVNISQSKLKLQGSTAIDNLDKIVKMIDKSAATKAEKEIKKLQASTTTVAAVTTVADNNNTTTAVSTTKATQPTTKAAKTTKKAAEYELQSKYKISFTKDAIVTMTKNSENKYIKAMQERLCDLGYVEKDNVTGYFGDVTEQCIKSFEKKNNLSQTGKVSEKMLKVLFSSNAK